MNILFFRNGFTREFFQGKILQIGETGEEDRKTGCFFESVLLPPSIWKRIMLSWVRGDYIVFPGYRSAIVKYRLLIPNTFRSDYRKSKCKDLKT